MLSFDVSTGTAQPAYGFVPSHKITITHGSNTYTYWYVQESNKCRAFDSDRDRDLVELIHAKGQELQIAQFESFAIGTERNYHLQRLSSHEFLIKSLR